MHVYGLRDIKHGTGFNRDARFIEVNDERLRLIAHAPALRAMVENLVARLETCDYGEDGVFGRGCDRACKEARALLATIVSAKDGE